MLPKPGDRRTGLVRAIGLGSAILFVVGSVIGSGIFLTTGGMAAVIPSASLLLAAWVARRRAGHRRRPDLRRDGRDVSALRRRLRLPPRGVRTADGIPLRLGGAARRHQRRDRRRRGRVCRVPELLRSRRSRPSACSRVDAVDDFDFGRAARRRRRRSPCSARSTTSASAAATRQRGPDRREGRRGWRRCRSWRSIASRVHPVYIADRAAGSRQAGWRRSASR